MNAIAQYIDGASDIDVTLSAGDQILLNAGAIFTDDDASSDVLGQLLLNGVAVQAQRVSPATINSLNFSYAYSASTSEIVNFEIASPSDTVEDTFFSYLVVSNSASGTPVTIEGTVSVDNMGINLLGGILIFAMVVAFLAFFFKRDSWI